MVKGKRRDPDGLPSFKLTSFHVPPQVNNKNMNSNYLKNDSQTVWSRRPGGTEKRKREDPAEGTPKNPEKEVAEVLAGSKTIVLHPGSQTLRIGLATDYQPHQIPMVIARRQKQPLTSQPGPSATQPNGKGKERAAKPVDEEAMDVEEQDLNAQLHAPETLESIIASLRQTHLNRTHALKLRPIPQGHSLVQNFNSDALDEGGEKIEDFNDPLRVEWWDPSADKPGSPQTVVGTDVERIPPDSNDWVIRRPFRGRGFNLEDYGKLQILLDDLELLLEEVLKKQMGISRNQFESYSVILAIPDNVSKLYIREMSQLLLATMGFKQICVQQESLAATFGAGISAACVVDIGATRTSVACVEDGVVVNDSKMTLAYGGNDVTSFLSTLLVTSFFPYKELDLTKSYDWALIEGLKEKLCTLNEAQIGVNLNEFMTRRPGKPTMKYRFKVFDEVILAPMGLFEPRAMKFNVKEPKRQEVSEIEGVDDLSGEWILDVSSAAMISSTQHLRPSAPADGPDPSPADLPIPDAMPASTNVSPPPSDTLPPAAPFSETPLSETLAPVEAAELATTALAVELPASKQSSETDAPLKATFDTRALAGRVALDAAVVHSIACAGGEEKAKKFASNVLVIGGGASLASLGWALESRLHPLILSRFPTLAQATTQPVQIIAPPREIDPRILVWKGTSVFGRLESVQEFWVGRSEWDQLGVRALREKSLFV